MLAEHRDKLDAVAQALNRKRFSTNLKSSNLLAHPHIINR